MITFKDLRFRDISDTHGPLAKQAWEEFDNGFEASVVQHKYSYGGDKGMYEVGVFFNERMCDPLGWDDTVKGFLDDVELSEIKNIEKKIYEEVKSSNPEIIDTINNTGKLEEEVEQKLVKIIEQFKKVKK